MNRPTRYGLTAAVTAAMVMAGVIRAALPVLGADVRGDLGLSRTSFGVILTTFLVALAISAPITGRLADTFGGRRTLFLRFGFAAGGLALTAAAPGFWWLGGAVAFTGFGLSAGNPATNKLIADHLPPGSRGTALGIKQSGGQVGVLIAGAVLPALATIWSWRVAVALAIIGPALAAIVLVRLVPPDEPRRAWRSSQPLGTAGRNGLTRLLIVGGLIGAGVQSVFGFLPLYAVEEIGMSTTTAGLVAATVAGTSSIARVLWARAGERSQTVATPAMILAVGATCGTLLIWSASRVGPATLWAGAIVLGSTAESWNAVANFAVIGIAGAASTGRASGVVNSVALGAGAIGPVIFGRLVDGFDSYTPAWIGCAAVFCIAGAAAASWRSVATPPKT